MQPTHLKQRQVGAQPHVQLALIEKISILIQDIYGVTDEIKITIWDVNENKIKQKTQ